MAYTIKLHEQLQIVNVLYTGIADLDIRMQAVKQVCENHGHLKPLNILVDVRGLVMDLSFDEQQAFGKYLADNHILSDARVAVLHKPGFNPNAIIDDSAFNNGYMLAQFSSQADAELWLLNKI
jgi:hypothetical protein